MPDVSRLVPFALCLACARTTPSSDGGGTTESPLEPSTETGSATGSGTTEAPPAEGNIVELTRSPYGLLFTEIEVQDEVVTAMVDFGDPHPFAISGTLAERLGIELTATGATGHHADGSAFDMYVGTATSIVVGTHRLESVEVRTGEGELEQVSQVIGTPFDAVVGWGYVSEFDAVLDYEASTLTLYANGSPEAEVTFSVDVDHELYLRVPVTLGGQPRKLIIDTGAPVSVLDTAAAEALGASGPSTSLELGLGGHVQPHDFVVQDVALLGQIGAVGVLGGDYLARWRVVFPAGARRIDFLER